MSSKRSIGWRIFDWAIGAVIITIVIALAYPILAGTPKIKHTNWTLASQAKQLTLALLMYAADCDAKPPFFDPFEFGVDPLDPYVKNPTIHDIPYPPHAEPHKPGTTDFRFQYLLNRKTIRDGFPARLVLGPLTTIENPSEKIILTGNLINRKGVEMLAVAFVDGHVKPSEKTKLGAAMPPFGDFPNLFRLDELLYASPEDKTPTKFWAVPYEAVEMAAKAGGGRK